eukprot:99775-Amphidinium_carterae.1
MKEGHVYTVQCSITCNLGVILYHSCTKVAFKAALATAAKRMKNIGCVSTLVSMMVNHQCNCAQELQRRDAKTVDVQAMPIKVLKQLQISSKYNPATSSASGHDLNQWGAL